MTRAKQESTAVLEPAIAADEAPIVKVKPKGVFHYLGVGLSVALMLLVIGMGAILIVIPKMNNAIPLTILTQSMEPLLPPGTLIVDRPVKAKDVHIGDVVTYQIESGKSDVITHRVIGIALSNDGKRTFTFKGDNNANPDTDPVVAAQIKGRVWYSVPVIGYVSLWMNGPARAVVVPIAAGILFTFAVWMFVAGAIEHARKKRREDASASGV
ncbi:MAG: signal peptidase [Glaciihabitans sp.]|jgi:signal peptidase|nr:signal peptidase [Glaciihabitans sp.]